MVQGGRDETDCAMVNSIKKNNQDVDEPAPRRKFLITLWMALGATALAQLAWVVFSFLKPHKKAVRKEDTNSIIDAGLVDDFLISSVTAFPRGRFYLARLDDGGFLAISRQCTHLGCTIPWDDKEKRFVCPCHSSVFDIRGDVVDTPAPRALDLYSVTIVNQMVKVDTGNRIRRGSYQTDQVVHPEKT
jgi:cytochrome b6-f complex iron-sulfur subunit